MEKFLRMIIIISSIIMIVITMCSSNYVQAQAQQTCSTYSFSNNNRRYSTCNSLPLLNSFLHWTYHQSNHTVDIAFRHTDITTSTWVSWALNLEREGMDGAQSLVAFQNSSGQGLLSAYTSPIIGHSTSLQPGPLSFPVPNIEAEYINNNNEIIIYATLELPVGQTTFNQVWQSGPLSGDTLGIHPTSGDNMRSIGTVDFLSGQTTSGSENFGASLRRRRNVHGVLNAVSWGILMPIGAITARYLKVFKSANPAWFYIHVACQTSAYIVGVAGWGTGLKLGSDSSGTTHNPHRNIGITLFCLGTLQVFALLLRPKPDHKYRLYWNIYHHIVGYTVITLSIVNIFDGLDILAPEEKKWRRAYTGIIICLGAIAIFLEAITWIIVLRRKSKHSNKFDGGNAHGSHQLQAP